MTKRQLGLSLVLLGVGVIAGSFAVDLVGAGRYAGIGPTQRLALWAAGGVVLLGLSLVPFGNRPA